MSEWTAKEFEEFERLFNMTGSARQMDRISARVEMPVFVAKHGMRKCDEMHKQLMASEKE